MYPLMNDDLINFSDNEECSHVRSKEGVVGYGKKSLMDEDDITTVTENRMEFHYNNEDTLIDTAADNNEKGSTMDVFLSMNDTIKPDIHIDEVSCSLTDLIHGTKSTRFNQILNSITQQPEESSQLDAPEESSLEESSEFNLDAPEFNLDAPEFERHKNK
ncbi:hypothetical protein BDB01DRAFT_485503 [Pilobolus umbonatus]|nr:hypothetical protein BDB01DRAFT_485503 [Pilobolus umbonatus]